MLKKRKRKGHSSPRYTQKKPLCLCSPTRGRREESIQPILSVQTATEAPGVVWTLRAEAQKFPDKGSMVPEQDLRNWMAQDPPLLTRHPHQHCHHPPPDAQTPRTPPSHLKWGPCNNRVLVHTYGLVLLMYVYRDVNENVHVCVGMSSGHECGCPSEHACVCGQV